MRPVLLLWLALSTSSPPGPAPGGLVGGPVQAHEGSVHLGGRGWVGEGLGGSGGGGGEGLDEVADEAAPSLGGGVAGCGDDAGVGHQDQGQVLVGEVVAQPAGGLGALE